MEELEQRRINILLELDLLQEELEQIEEEIIDFKDND